MADAGGGNLGDSTLYLRTDDSEYTRGLQNAEGSFTRFEAATIARAAQWNILKDVWSVISGAVGMFVGSLGAIIGPAEESENAVAALNQALLDSKEFALSDSQALQDLASAHQAITKYSDEEVLSAERLLVQYGATQANIGRLTQAALNLSSALGRDLNSSAMLLGKALSGNAEALNKLGIEADKTKQKSDDLAASLDHIRTRFGEKAATEAQQYAEALLEIERGYGDTSKKSAELDVSLQKVRDNFNGDVVEAVKKYGDEQLNLAKSQSTAATSAEKLNTVLGAIEDKFGGAAAAEGSTFSGMVKRVANAWDDMKEAMGRVIINSPTLRSALGTLQEGLEKAGKWIDDNRDKIGTWVDQGIKVAISAVATVVDYIGSFLTGLDDLKKALPGVSAGIKSIAGFIDDMGKSTSEATYKIEKVGGTWTNVKETIEAAGIKPQVDVDGGVTLLQQFKTQAVQILTEAGSAAGTAFVTGIGGMIVQGWANIGSWVGQLTNPSFWSELGGEAGNAMMQGFQAAVTSFFTSIWDGLKNYARSNPIPMPIEASGSPSMPFTQYFTSYAPKVLRDFASSAQTLRFDTGITGLVQSLGANEAAYLGPVVETLRQGVNASADQVRSLISELDSHAATWRFYANQQESGQDPFGIMQGNQLFGIPTASQIAGVSQGLSGELVRMLSAIQQKEAVQSQPNSTATLALDASERTAQAAERTAAGIYELGGALQSGSYGGGLLKTQAQVAAITRGTSPTTWTSRLWQ